MVLHRSASEAAFAVPRTVGSARVSKRWDARPRVRVLDLFGPLLENCTQTIPALPDGRATLDLEPRQTPGCGSRSCIGRPQKQRSLGRERLAARASASVGMPGFVFDRWIWSDRSWRTGRRPFQALPDSRATSTAPCKNLNHTQRRAPVRAEDVCARRLAPAEGSARGNATCHRFPRP